MVLRLVHQSFGCLFPDWVPLLPYKARNRPGHAGGMQVPCCQAGRGPRRCLQVIRAGRDVSIEGLLASRGEVSSSQGMLWHGTMAPATDAKGGETIGDAVVDVYWELNLPHPRPGVAGSLFEGHKGLTAYHAFTQRHRSVATTPGKEEKELVTAPDAA